MKTLEELKAFCEGYLACYFGSVDMDVGGADDWVVWGGYDINLAGAEYSQHAEDDELRCDAYKAGWVDNIGEPIHSFTVKGESK